MAPWIARSPVAVTPVVARICSQRGAAAGARLRPIHSKSSSGGAAGSRQTRPPTSSGSMPRKKTSGSASISSALPGSRRATPSLMDWKRGTGAGRYSNMARGSCRVTWRRRSSEARKANSASRRREARPWRRRQDQKAKPVISASVTAINTMADSVNCRDEATVMCSAAWAGDKAAGSPSKMMRRL